MSIKGGKDTRPIMVSIRCSTYNHERYIRDALEGFVMQKTNFRFEAIVHDDVSTDGTAAIIREYAEKYPNIIKPIYETVNQYSKHDGSLNRIMNAHMHGKYIAVCEGDDYWTDPYKLQKQVDFLENNPEFTMVWHDAYVETNGKIIKQLNRYDKDCESPISDIIFNGGLFIPTASILVKKDMIVNLPDISVRCDYTIQMYSAYMGKVYYMKDPMCVYRYNSVGSWTSKTINSDRQKQIKRYEGEKDILNSYNNFFNYKYSEAFERRMATELFNMAFSLNLSEDSKYYLSLRDKYNIKTNLAVRLRINGYKRLSKVIYCLLKIKHIIYTRLNKK